MRTLTRNLSAFTFSVCVIFSIAAIALGQQPIDVNAQLKRGDVGRLTTSGFRLTSAEAEQLENTLATDPANLKFRISLVSYYSSRQDETFRAKKCEHALWLIRNIPDSEVLHQIGYLSMPKFDACSVEAKEAWLKHLKTYPNNPVVMSNAADFFQLSDRPQALKLLGQLATLDPENPRWPREMGHVYMLEMQEAQRLVGAGKDPKEAAASAYQSFEQAYKLTADSLGKRFLLGSLATTAFEAGQMETAQRWSRAAVAEKSNSDADSVHHAHIVMGRIALRSGDLPEARSQLIQAGQSQGSPVLGSFGPSMTLAKELLEKGERDTVLEYFQECAGFWNHDHGQLAQWTATVRGGGIPNFGANLVY